MSQQNEHPKKGLGNKLLDEVKSAVGLLKKDCHSHGLSFQWDEPVHIMDASFRPTTYNTKPGIKTNIINTPKTAWSVSTPPLSATPLFSLQNCKAKKERCQWQAVAIQSEPKETLKTAAIIKHIGLDNVNHTQPQGISIKKLHTSTHCAPVEPFKKPLSYVIKAPKKQTVSTAVISTPKIKTHTQTVHRRLWHLPIVKNALSLKALSPELKQGLREKLAANAKTSTDNVAIIHTYRCVTPTIYDGIKIDDKNRLTCTPKPDSTGNSFKARQTRKKLPLFYLVFGQKRDDKQPIKAFVPQVLNAAEDKTNA